MADNGTVGRVRTMYVKDTSERMKKLGNEVNAVLQKPKGQVTKDELGKALENTEKMRTADPPLTHVEELNRLSMHRGLVERAGGEGLMTPQEIKNRPDSMRFALGAPGGGGAGGIRKSGGTGPMLPKTGAATGQKPLPAGGGGVAIQRPTHTRVGRWMSKAEYEKMKKTGRVQDGAGGATYGATSGPDSFGKQAPPGSVYVEYDVPTNSVLKGSKPDWVMTVSPDANGLQKAQLLKQGGEFSPAATNISDVLKAK